MGLFRKAVKSQAKLRMAIIGPSGSGKTFTSLATATGIIADSAGRIAVIDTERGSASKYADRFDFDTLTLDDFDPRTYIQAILAAEAEGYAVLVIDSLSHAWVAELNMVDNLSARSQSKNTFAAWRHVTPLHNALVDAILRANCHVIATMRSKVDYVLQPNERGQMVPTKVGMAPVQREGMDYEFDIVGDLDLTHRLMIGKTRYSALADAVIATPGSELGRKLIGWLSDGKPVEEPPPPPSPASVSGPASVLRAAASPPVATQDEVRGSVSAPATNGHVEPTPVPTPAPPSSLGSPEVPTNQAPPSDGPLPSTPEQHRDLMALVSSLGMEAADFSRMLARRGVETVPELSAFDATDIIGKLIKIYEQAHLGETIQENIQAANPAERLEDEQADTVASTPLLGGQGTEGQSPVPDSDPDSHVIADVERREKAEPKAAGSGKSRKSKPAASPETDSAGALAVASTS